MRKIKAARRASVVARTIKERTQALDRRPVRKMRDSLHHQLSTTGGRTLRPLCIRGGERGQRRVLLLWETWKPNINANLARSWWLETETALHSLVKNTS